MNNNRPQTPINPQIQSFLESLRQRSAGTLPSHESGLPFPPERTSQKRLEEQRKAEFFRARTREFNQVYSHQKQAEAQEIQQLRDKLQSLSQSVKTLNQEVHTATLQTTPAVQPGIYHKTFLQHLSQVIDLLQSQVESSNTWLHLFNSKNKKSQYWNMVAQKGTSFMLSNERQVATSVG